MSDKLKYQVITDEEIQYLFDGTNFGKTINESLKIQREELVKWIENKRDHYWVGHTAFQMLLAAGLVNNNLPYHECTPTVRGLNFITQELNKGDKQS